MLTKTDIEKYFIAEKQESIVFLSIGIIAIIMALIGLLAYKNAFLKGAALPLIIIGIIQITVGYTIFKRSDADRIRVVYAYDLDPSTLKTKELPRMVTVNKKFIIYRYGEIFLICTSVIIAFYLKNKLATSNNWGSNEFWFGFCIAVAIQGITMLACDFFAEKRALHYTNLLQAFVNK